MLNTRQIIESCACSECGAKAGEKCKIAGRGDKPGDFPVHYARYAVSAGIGKKGVGPQFHNRKYNRKI